MARDSVEEVKFDLDVVPVYHMRGGRIRGFVSYLRELFVWLLEPVFKSDLEPREAGTNPGRVSVLRRLRQEAAVLESGEATVTKQGRCAMCSHIWHLRLRDIYKDDGEWLFVAAHGQDMLCQTCEKLGANHYCSRTLRDVTPIPMVVSP